MLKLLDTFFQLVAPKKKTKVGGASSTPTYDPNSSDGVITIPAYRDHLTDIFTSRQASDSRDLMKSLFRHDPDVSAALNAYLTMADTKPMFVARDIDGNIDRDATKQIESALTAITKQTDYTLGFQLKHGLSTLFEQLRYMLLLRGAIGTELIMGKSGLPENLRIVDMASIEWIEKKAGEYKPQQSLSGSNDKINLDIPTFFVSFYRKDPTSIYSDSSFVASVNTIAARQQVINDLYRLMQLTGFPRIKVQVIEEILIKNAPASVKEDNTKLRDWLNQRLTEITGSFNNVKPDQPLVHWDSVNIEMLNDQKPGAAMDVSSIIDTLNAQNQAALKTMATVIGRGAAGVNTGSVEARIAAMNADELNKPLAELLERVLSFIMHMNGFQGFVEVKFAKAELRPDLELEPQLTLKASRLRQDLSDGLITDDEYHLWMYGRIRPDSVEELSGTGFMNPAANSVEAADVSPNGDPLGRSMSGEGKKAQDTSKSNTVK